MNAINPTHTQTPGLHATETRVLTSRLLEPRDIHVPQTRSAGRNRGTGASDKPLGQGWLPTSYDVRVNPSPASSAKPSGRDGPA